MLRQIWQNIASPAHLPWFAMAAGGLVVVVGVWFNGLVALLCGLLLVGCGGLLLWSWRRTKHRRGHSRGAADEGCTYFDEEDPGLSNSVPDDVESLVGQMLARGRYALLLRPQIAQSLSVELYQKAYEALQQEMGIVPAGEVQLEPSLFDSEYAALAERGEGLTPIVIPVQSVFLDRYPVTNKQYQRFVAAGGYQEMAIWDQEIWPAVLDFGDSTGHPGPRFWKNGHYPPGEANLPVAGISWYEAAAYARWVGKRLPTDAEWVKAGSWPVTLSHTTRLQRKYPWGDTMDRRKANVWGSGPGRIVPVDEFAEGVSVGGLYQLIGNVWEWTASNLDLDPRSEAQLRGERTLLKSIRGGAFDTYFENQANCQFASGENPIARKHNIGFRCALSVPDIAAPRRQPSEPRIALDEFPQEPVAEEAIA